MNIEVLHKMLRRGDAVMKPLVGEGGRFVSRISNVEGAHNLVAMTHLMDWAICPYVNIQSEIRVVVLDGIIQLVYKKVDPVLINGLKLFNLSLGAKAEAMRANELDSTVANLAIEAMRVVGLRFGAVDIVISDEGEAKVLELNAAFSLVGYAGMNNAAYQQVALFYEDIVSYMFS